MQKTLLHTTLFRLGGISREFQTLETLLDPILGPHVGWLVGWLIVQATRSEAPRIRDVVPSRNTPFRPVELGFKEPMHVTDRGPPDAEAFVEVLQKVRPTGAHPPTAADHGRFNTDPAKTMQGIQIRQKPCKAAPLLVWFGLVWFGLVGFPF